MTMIEFTEAERDAMQAGANDFETRTRRINAFDDIAFDLMKRAILEGDITPDVSSRVERDIVAALKAMPEALAEMTLYTLEISVSVHGRNQRSGWPWARYTSRKYLHMDCIFGPYRDGVSAWTDPSVAGGVVRFQ